MSVLHDECGVAAVCVLRGGGESRVLPDQGADEVSRLMPRMLLDIQNRGQLAAGMTTYDPDRSQLINTFKNVGGVSEVFRLSHRSEFESIMRKHAGRAAIGHVRIGNPQVRPGEAKQGARQEDDLQRVGEAIDEAGHRR